jgi:predicted dehydrogenase
MTLRIGIIGCGGIANAHINAYNAVGGTTITAVTDVRAEAAAAAAAELPDAVPVADVPAMIAAGVDAVSVCTPPSTHPEICMPLLEAGIPVLCEKPLALTAEHAEPLVRTAAAAAVPFMTAYCHRFHPAVIELRRLIADDVLGEPRLFRNIFAGYADHTGNHRANPALSGGGCVIDNCSHALDLFRHLVGDVVAVDAAGGAVFQKTPIEDIGLLLVEADNGAYGEIMSSYSLAVGGAWVEWYGSKGTAIISYWNPGVPDLRYRTADDADWITVDCSGHCDRFAGEIGHFLDCVRSGATPSISAADGQVINRVVDAAYAAMADGQRRRLTDASGTG